MTLNKAYAYIRVSGQAQVKGDGFRRQENAIKKYAEGKGYTIKKIYRDEGVSGALLKRPALANMMVSLETNGHGVKTVIIERVDRLARDLMIQETIIDSLKKKGFDIRSATDGDLLKDDPTRKLVRQVLGAISEYDKSMLVQKLRVARERQKKLHGKCEGRKAYIELRPEVIKKIKKLRRKPRNGKRLSLKETAIALNDENLTTATGKRFTISRVKNVIYQSESFR